LLDEVEVWDGDGEGIWCINAVERWWLRSFRAGPGS
jgi:hypothetical protein